MVALTLNGQRRYVEAAPDTPLLWVLREHLLLTGAKYGCGIGACGACTVLLDDAPVRSCITPISAAEGRNIRTIEGIHATHPVVSAWIAEQVPQCGFCQPAQVLTAIALLEKTPRPDDSAITGAFAGNLCRCGTYPRIRRAVRRAAGIETAGAPILNHSCVREASGSEQSAEA